MSIQLRKSDSGIYRQTLRIQQHTIFADVAKDLGGDNSAPDPHDYYDAALAACKAITVMMYAKRKQLPLDYTEKLMISRVCASIALPCIFRYWQKLAQQC